MNKEELITQRDDLQTDLNRLQPIVRNNTATDEQLNIITSLYKKYINANRPVCSTCATEVRDAFEQLREWYCSSQLLINQLNNKINSCVQPDKMTEARENAEKYIDKK